MACLAGERQVCDSVSLYGFSSYRPSRQGSATDRYRDEQMRYHYFDQVAGVTKHHSFDLAYEVSPLTPLPQQNPRAFCDAHTRAQWTDRGELWGCGGCRCIAR